MKKLSLILLAALFILCFAACGEKAPEAPDTDAVRATVNGEAVTAEEIDYFKSRCRADIINDFAEKYGVKDFSDFWERDFDGTTPSAELEKAALSQAAEAKIKLVMMRENGVYDDISFAGLKKKAEQYNLEHENVQGSVGITSIDMSGFYTYYVSTGEMELKNILAEGELKPTDAELAAAAKENPNLTENGLISVIVSQKYDSLIESKIASAVIEE